MEQVSSYPTSAHPKTIHPRVVRAAIGFISAKMATRHASPYDTGLGIRI
jgi:hypothetical protein